MRSCKIWVAVIVIVPGGKQSQILLCRLAQKSYFVGFAQKINLGVALLANAFNSTNVDVKYQYSLKEVTDRNSSG